MRKISLALLTIGALLAVSLYWQGAASAQELKPVTPEGFGKKIAGSWYDEFMHYPDPNDPNNSWPGTGVLTFGSDGTLTWSSLGPVGDQAGGGTWEKTGRREITLTVLIMGFTPDPIRIRTCGPGAAGSSLNSTAISRLRPETGVPTRSGPATIRSGTIRSSRSRTSTTRAGRST